MSWAAIIEQERYFFEAVGERLSELSQTAEQTNNQALERIYAGFYQAYQLGLESLHQFENDISSVERASQGGSYLTTQEAILSKAGVPKHRWASAVHVLGAIRCLVRPSDVFRQSIREQRKAIVNSLKLLVGDESIPNEALAQDIQVIAGILCSIDSSIQSSNTKKWYKNPILWGVSGLAAGVGGVALYSWYSKKKEAKDTEDNTLEEPEKPISNFFTALESPESEDLGDQEDAMGEAELLATMEEVSVPEVSEPEAEQVEAAVA